MNAEHAGIASWIRVGLALTAATGLACAAGAGCSSVDAPSEQVGPAKQATDDPCGNGQSEYQVAPGQWVVCVYGDDDPPEDPCATFPEMCNPDPCDLDPSSCGGDSGAGSGDSGAGSSGDSGSTGDPPAPTSDIPYPCVESASNHCALIRNSLCPNQGSSEVATFLAEPGYGSVDSQPKVIETSQWCRDTYPSTSQTPGTPFYAGGNGSGFIYVACCHN